MWWFEVVVVVVVVVAWWVGLHATGSDFWQMVQGQYLKCRVVFASVLIHAIVPDPVFVYLVAA